MNTILAIITLAAFVSGCSQTALKEPVQQRQDAIVSGWQVDWVKHEVWK